MSSIGLSTETSCNFLNSVSSNSSIASLNSVSSKISDYDTMNYSVKLSFAHADFDCMILVGFSFLKKTYNFALIVNSDMKTLKLNKTNYYESYNVFKRLADNFRKYESCCDDCKVFGTLIEGDDNINNDLVEMFENINFDLNNIIQNFYS